MAIIKGFPQNPNKHVDEREAAETLAIAALNYIIADEDLLQRFFAETGMAPDTLREAAKSPNFFSFVLDFICSNDETVLGFAAQEKMRPEKIVAARTRLAGPQIWDSP
jgi:hypothetical protein